MFMGMFELFNFKTITIIVSISLAVICTSRLWFQYHSFPKGMLVPTEETILPELRTNLEKADYGRDNYAVMYTNRKTKGNVESEWILENSTNKYKPLDKAFIAQFPSGMFQSFNEHGISGYIQMYLTKQQDERSFEIDIDDNGSLLEIIFNNVPYPTYTPSGIVEMVLSTLKRSN